ncbi:hypothetical protein [Flavobacterium sp. WC2430]|uniref:hypothetical protein n=1 Tax=Flavobacterium sp. WC2430 TaxID=3234137 RepID=UPI0034666A16
MIIEASFNSFITKENYLNLQNKFNCQDDRNSNQDVFSEIRTDDFKIIYKDCDENNIENYKTIWFEKDFLVGEINFLAQKYIENFELRIETEFLYKKEQKLEFVDIKLQRINDLDQHLNEFDYLSNEIISLLHEQLIIVSNYIFDRYKIVNYSNDNKIKVNLSQTELILLMLVLRENKIIKENHNNTLGQWIEKTFLAYNSENNQFVEVKQASKKISDFIGGNKTSIFALNHLSTIFSIENFFNLKI